MSDRWRFVESNSDGDLWLRNPSELTACIEIESGGVAGQRVRRRLMIATRGWLEKHLLGVRDSTSGPLWAGIPSLVVVPNATGNELRRYVDRVVTDGGIDDYSTVVR